eukprot:snap_masked-scaffold_7-processed-gene-16.28-mRNA-1 protein AED:0.25 eAED:0.25 QI:0/-1/0/1/-1/1/1/0/108
MKNVYETSEDKEVGTPHIPSEYLYKENEEMDPKLYQQIVASLIYITEICRPDIAYIVNRLSVFMNAPTRRYLKAAKRVLTYLFNTKKRGIFIHKNREKGNFTINVDAS